MRDNFDIKAFTCLAQRRMQTPHACSRQNKRPHRNSSTAQASQAHTRPSAALHSARSISPLPLPGHNQQQCHLLKAQPRDSWHLHLGHYHALPTKAETQLSWSFSLEDSQAGILGVRMTRREEGKGDHGRLNYHLLASDPLVWKVTVISSRKFLLE